MRNRIAAASALAVLLVLAGPTVPTSAAAPDAWPVTYGDGGNSGNNPGETVIRADNAARLRPAWISSGPGTYNWAPPVSSGVAYRVLDGVAGAFSLAAISARTGATLWTVALPARESYAQALVLAGHYVVVPFWGLGIAPGGLTVVDLTTRRIAWTSYLPPSAIPSQGNTVIGNPLTDGTRIFVTGSSNEINTYRVSDGALLWTTPMTPFRLGGYNTVDAMAVSAGVLYTTGTEGLVARDTASGRQLWTAGAAGRPVVAGGRVFAFYADNVVAFSAGGCGRPTCGPLWQTALPHSPEHVIGGADADMLFVTVHRAGPGYLARLSASTGHIEWTASVGSYMTGLVRGGNTIWLFAEYRNGQGYDHNHIVGFSTTATRAKPLRTISLADTDHEWFPQQLAVSDGTLLEQPNGPQLLGYRIPGT